MLLAIACVAVASIAPAQATAPPARSPAQATRAEPGATLTVYLMTMGVGQEVWEQFGHNALWFHDAATNQDVVYNWGLFDFNAPHFIPHFLQGLMRYSMGGFDLESTLVEYRERDRSVWAQELDLTPAQKLSMLQYVEWNSLPQNRDYWYNYFTDNCSTRVRDIIDRTLGGQLRAAYDRLPTGTTYRSEALRLTQVDLPLSTGIDIGLGRPADHPLTAWEEMFIPMHLRDYVRNLRVRTDSSGATKPLVISERELYASHAHNEPARPPFWTPWFLCLGVLVAGLFVLLGRLGTRTDGGHGARVAEAVIFAVWSLTTGFLGMLLTLLWTVTNHTFAYRNESLLLFNPLWLALVVLAPMYLTGGRAPRSTRGIAMTLAALSAVALLTHLVGVAREDNMALIALALPPALAMAWVLHSTRPTSTRT